MLWVHLRDDHGHVRRPAVGAVVGDDRAFQLGIRLFQRTDVFFLHVHCTEDKINGSRDFFLIRFRVQNHQRFGFLRHGGLHGPALASSFLIGLAGRPGTGSHHGQLEPRVIFQQGHKTLAHHSGGTHHTHSILFHAKDLPRLFKLPENGPSYQRMKNQQLKSRWHLYYNKLYCVFSGLYVSQKRTDVH